MVQSPLCNVRHRFGAIKLRKETAALTVCTIVISIVVVAWYLHGQSSKAGINYKTSTGRFSQVPTPVRLKMDLVIVPHFVYNSASDSTVLQREKEYMTALQRNLNHEFVRKIHILTTDASELTQRLNRFELSNRSKLLTFELRCIRTMRDVFEYISQNLVGLDVMFLNADIYLGSGFDRVDPVVMRENKIVYSLTTQSKKEESCGEIDRCLGMWFYHGSHDAFLFHLYEPFPVSFLEHLDYLLPSSGMENVLIWLFKTKLKHCVLNPCSILEIFHLHCSNLRNHIKRVRVATSVNNGLSPFTKELVCTYSQQVQQESLLKVKQWTMCILLSTIVFVLILTILFKARYSTLLCFNTNQHTHAHTCIHAHTPNLDP